MKHSERKDVAQKLRAAGLNKKAERFDACHQDGEGRAFVCVKCGHVEGYQPFSCMVIGCPYCSQIQSAPVRETYEDALLSLWLKREAGEWTGRFWFLTFTYRIDDGESLDAAIERVRRSYDALGRWLLKTYGKRQGGMTSSVEIGPAQVIERGQAGQVHVHSLLALDSCKQIGRYRYVVGKESGQSLIVRADFDKAGDIEKEGIEAKWRGLIEKDCPVSRIYEVAPGGLPLKVDREKVKASLERLGLSGDKLKKALYYNTRAPIDSACRELLKYVTKTGKLSAGALAEVIIAFHKKRRIWSLGVLYGKRRQALVAYLKTWQEAHDGKHPLGDREGCKCSECSKCGSAVALESAWSVACRDPQGLAGALREYMTRRRWLDTANNSPGKVSGLAPPGLRRWLERLDAGADGNSRVIDLNDW